MLCPEEIIEDYNASSFVKQILSPRLVPVMRITQFSFSKVEAHMLLLLDDQIME